MRFKAAIFDMDGTLVDSLMLWDMLWSSLGEKYLNDKGFAPSVEDDKSVRTLTLKDAMKLIHKNYSIGENSDELLEIANRLIKDFYASTVELKAGVLDFLKCCKSNQTKMCIASATSPELIDIAISHLGIGEYFSNIFSCTALGKGKDKPDIFLHACNALGEDISETWVFEDSLTAIKTAAKAGMPTVGIYDRYNFGQDEIKQIANEYIDNGETLLKLISK